MAKKRKPTGSYSKRRVKQQKTIIGVLSISFILLVVGLGVGWQLGWFAPVDTTTAGTGKATSTFTLIDYRTGEDVSAWLEVSVWIEDPDDLPFDAEDPYRIINFDEEVNSADADDADVDLRNIGHAWLEIDPDFASDYSGYNGVFNTIVSNDFRQLTPGTNYDYIFYVYHEPSNVSINVLNRASDEDFLGDFDDADEWSTTSNIAGAQPFPWYNFTDTGRFTVIMNVPYNSTDGLHEGVTGGDEWDIDHDEFQDMSRDELFWLSDQSNFRTAAPYYDMVDDTLRAYSSHEELERLTNAFAVRWRFNDTISLVAANVNQVNMTLADREGVEVPAELIVSGTDIYAVFYEPITFTNHMYNFDIDIFTIGNSINCTYVQTGRVIVPQGDSPFSLGAFAALGTANLWDQLFDTALGRVASLGQWWRPPTT